MPHIPNARRLRVTRADRDILLAWQEGVHLTTSTGLEIDELRDLVTADRIELAAALRIRGDQALAASSNRDAISRYYYSMYHCLRAATFHTYGGDDHQSHNDLPRRLPTTFPNRAIWANELKDARERRNSADYDPYPKSEPSWYTIATNLQSQARDLLRVTRAYLRARGCRYL
jgi:uncharacterized protein (UPF0332 family)